METLAFARLCVLRAQVGEANIPQDSLLGDIAPNTADTTEAEASSAKDE